LPRDHFRFSEFELDVPKRLLLRDGEPVSLNPKALDLLVVLVESRGEIVSKDDLLEKVWPDQIIEEGNLKVHVSALRKAFGQTGNDHRFIVTVPGRGYSFVADLADSSNDEVVVETHRYSTIVSETSESIDDDGRELLALPAPATRKRAVVIGLSIFVLAAGSRILVLPAHRRGQSRPSSNRSPSCRSSMRMEMPTSIIYPTA
jgi:DNA-binding winged helix-turn-helix (wHTH) protein